MCLGKLSTIDEARNSSYIYHRNLVFHRYALRCWMVVDCEQTEMSGFCHGASGPMVLAGLACY